jgi:hypothetical protein
MGAGKQRAEVIYQADSSNEKDLFRNFALPIEVFIFYLNLE